MLTLQMWVCIIGQAIFQLSLLVFLLFADLSKVSFLHVPATLSVAAADGVRNSLIFNVFVFCQLFNEFNCRKIESGAFFFPFFFSHSFYFFLSLLISHLQRRASSTAFSPTRSLCLSWPFPSPFRSS
jgi:Ca2+-transporting ATPase